MRLQVKYLLKFDSHLVWKADLIYVSNSLANSGWKTGTTCVFYTHSIPEFYTCFRPNPIYSWNQTGEITFKHAVWAPV